MMNTSYSYPATVLRVCVDTVEKRRIGGWVHCPQLEEPLSFTDIGNLLVQIEAIFDKRGFPLPYVKARTFTDADSVSLGECVNDQEKVAENVKKIEKVFGSYFTFTVYVSSRQNASWQGFILWLEDGRKDEFKSALELILKLDKELQRREEKTRPLRAVLAAQKDESEGAK